jgi:hypothetical protein
MHRPSFCVPALSNLSAFRLCILLKKLLVLLILGTSPNDEPCRLAEGCVTCSGRTRCIPTMSHILRLSSLKYLNILNLILMHCRYTYVIYNIACTQDRRKIMHFFYLYGRVADRLCGLLVTVPGYRSRGPGSIPGST